MFQRILVPLDGSSLAEQALPVAARLAHACGGTIILLNVVDISPMYVSYGVMQPIIMQDEIDRCLANARTYIDGLPSRSDLVGVHIKKQVVPGNPAVVILSEIEEQNIDLVVMSSHGNTGLKRWFLGSIAEKVMRHSSVPVFILRDGKPLNIHHRNDGAHFVRALVPLDASARSQDSISPAAALVAALSSPGAGILHLTQIVKMSEAVSEREKNILQQCARQNLQSISESIRDGLVANFGPDLHLTLTWSVSLDTDIATGIVKIAEKGEHNIETGDVEPCDFIAMTTHGYTGVQKWTMGSIADRVLHATRLPLMLVRPADMVVQEHQEKEAYSVHK
ncbi:MAG TPA: universal stress protein [Ktedonobacteraceae bacterium]|nr:universal stress protein [Ktedonobacteraceae bacterium]